MQLRLRFPPPGFFINDTRIVAKVGDRVLYDGSFRDGFDVSVVLPEGEHVLETEIHLGALKRRRRYPLPTSRDPYRGSSLIDAELRYSRVWGNFTSKLRISDSV